MDNPHDEKAKKFNIYLQKMNDFLGELLSDGPILIESENNLTMSQLRVLLLLKINNRMKMNQIAYCLKIHVSTATGLLDRMIKKNLVKRESGEDDRRLILCSLTEDGSKITDNIWKVVLENAQSLSDYVSMEELDIIGKSLDILQKAWITRKEKSGSHMIA
jgi:DNA-binding MarR family transcriptional regulator